MENMSDDVYLKRIIFLNDLKDIYYMGLYI